MTESQVYLDTLHILQLFGFERDAYDLVLLWHFSDHIVGGE